MSAKELNIGDYVRTKKGTIYKFNSKSNMAKNGAKKYMVKSSPNIIDLIEVGDLIKLKISKHLQEVEYIGEKELCLTECIYYDIQETKQKFENYIEWVITHEQLNEAKYEVNK